MPAASSPSEPRWRSTHSSRLGSRTLRCSWPPPEVTTPTWSSPRSRSGATTSRGWSSGWPTRAGPPGTASRDCTRCVPRSRRSTRPRRWCSHGDGAVYVIIAGAGKVGWNLARELISRDQEVTLIESDHARFRVIEEELDHAVQYGDATELWVLERAGIQRADLTIAVTGDDEDNILICQVSKEKYGCQRIVARVNNPRNLQHFRLLGVQPAVAATDLILRLIEHEVPEYGLVQMLALEEEHLEIIEIEVGAGSQAAGARVQDVPLPDGSLIISVLRNGTGFVPQAESVIEPGDQVLLILDPGLESQITPQFAPNGADPSDG